MKAFNVSAPLECPFRRLDEKHNLWICNLDRNVYCSSEESFSDYCELDSETSILVCRPRTSK